MHVEEIEKNSCLTSKNVKDDNKIDENEKFNEDDLNSEGFDKFLSTVEGEGKDKTKFDDCSFYDEDVQLLGPKHNMKVLNIIAVQIILLKHC